MSEYDNKDELANLTIRVPRSLLERIRREAKRDRRSVSQMARVILERWFEPSTGHAGKEGGDDHGASER